MQKVTSASAPIQQKITHKRNTIQKLLGHQKGHITSQGLAKLTQILPFEGGNETTIIETQKTGPLAKGNRIRNRTWAATERKNNL